jgi:hypothetical protein
LFFYSNEGKEPIHIHAGKAGMKWKYWLFVDEVDIKEAYSFNVTLTAKKKSRKSYNSILT